MLYNRISTFSIYFSKKRFAGPQSKEKVRRSGTNSSKKLSECASQSKHFSRSMLIFFILLLIGVVFRLVHFLLLPSIFEPELTCLAKLRDAIALQDSNIMMGMNQVTTQETRTMRTITLIAMIYLPASFTAVSFLLNSQPQKFVN
jgi:hypothetical protein